MLLGIDFGFGHIKYALSKNGDIDNLTIGKIPSIVAEISDYENMGDGLKYNDKSYYVGDQCAYSKDKKDIVRFEDLRTFAPLFLAQIFKTNKIKPKDIEALTICLAPIHYRHKDSFISGIENFMIDGVKYQFENIVVLSQGAVSKDVIEKKRASDDKSKDYMIIDVGFNTLDVCVVIGGEINEGGLSQNSVEGYGVTRMAQHILDNASDEIKTNNLSIKDAMNIIIQKSFRFRGVNYDFANLVNEAKKSYFQHIKLYLESKYGVYLDRLEKIYIIGGGSYYIDNYEEHFIKFDDGAEYFNAIGCLLETIKHQPKSKK